MTELRLNVDSKDIIEAGDYKSAQRGMLTFSKNAVYLGDGDKANKIIDAESLKTEIESKKLVEYINIATNNEKFEELKKQTSLEYIFKNWTKVGYTYNINTKKIAVNTPATISEINSWYFDPTTNSIVNPVNSAAYIYLLSPIAKDNYSVTLDLTTTFVDNDLIMLCVGEVVVNGVPYNLSFLRNKNASGAAWILKMNVLGWAVDDGANCPYSYALDSSKNDFVLSFSNQSADYRTDPIELKFERNGNTIKAWTGGGGIKTPREDTLISYTLPSSKPSNMSNDIWTALNLILGKPCVYGLGCESQPMHFKIKEQRNFSINDIYNAVDKKLYTWNGSNWVGTPKELDIPNNTLISNQSTKETFYYFNNAFNELVKNPLDIIGNKFAKLLTSVVKLIVGTGGQFPATADGLIAAFNEASSYHLSQNASIEILIKEDITLNKAITISNFNTNRVILASYDTANPATITSNVSSAIWMFTINYESTLYVRNLKFNGNTIHNIFKVARLSKLDFLNNVTLSNFNVGVCAETESEFLAINRTNLIENGSNNGVDVREGCNSLLIDININRCKNGINSVGATITTRNVNITNCTNAINVSSGGIVRLINPTLTGNTKGCNIAYNAVTSAGLVFK
ncbi:hypothetical protein DFW93_09245 [Campylobacter coli]|nr:hypothetical protein [Campylobacter coli]